MQFCRDSFNDIASTKRRKMSTNQRVALVTGAGSGIGKASSLALAAQGFSVVLTGRQIDPLNAVAREIEAQGGTALAVTCDVTSAASVDQLFAETVARFGRLDVLFNNAGRNAGSTPLDEYDVDLWNAVVAVSYTHLTLPTKA